MIVRVAWWDPMPDAPWAPEAGANEPGMHAIYHVVDPETGRGLSIAFAEDEHATDRAGTAIMAANAQRGSDTIDIKALGGATVYQIMSQSGQPPLAEDQP